MPNVSVRAAAVIERYVLSMEVARPSNFFNSFKSALVRLTVISGPSIGLTTPPLKVYCSKGARLL